MFFANSGSEANDTQVKLSWYAANARGQTQEEENHLAHQGLSRRDAGGGAASPALPTITRASTCRSTSRKFADCPHYYRNAEPGESERSSPRAWRANLDALIEREGPDTIAAMIAEPVMGAGGVILPPEGYFDAITQRARQATTSR